MAIKNIFDLNNSEISNKEVVRKSLIDYENKWYISPDICIASSGLGHWLDSADILKLKKSKGICKNTIYSNFILDPSFYWFESKDIENYLNSTHQEEWENYETIAIEKQVSSMSGSKKLVMTIPTFLLHAYVRDKRHKESTEN